MAKSCSSPTSCPGRTIGLVCLIEGRPAVLVVELPKARERPLPTQEIRAVRAQACLQPRDHLPRFPRAGGQPAATDARRWTDDRLPRAEPGSHCLVRHGRRNHAVDAGRHAALGPIPQDLRRGDRPARVGAAPHCPAGRPDRRQRRPGGLVLGADRPGLSRRDGMHHRQDFRQRGSERSRRSN